MKKVVIIGAGNIGSRHLQALKAVNMPLEILVIDPGQASLSLSRERYESMSSGKHKHKVSFLSEIPGSIKSVDLAIIATCADVRAEIVRNLLKRAEVKYLVLEKLLFTKRSDYKSIGALIKRAKTKTWVNCPMRMMPFYRDIQPEFYSRKIAYYATWSGYGLITSVIHYIDHMVSMTGSDDFTINTDGVDKKPILSKKKGFLDLTGILRVLFKNGSTGNLVCYNEGDFPILVQFHCNQARCIIKETEYKAWISLAREKWKWRDAEAPIPFQSKLTTKLTEDILSRGVCELTEYEQSAKIHLQLLEPVLKFLNKHSKKKYTDYPFT